MTNLGWHKSLFLPFFAKRCNMFIDIFADLFL